MEYRKTKELKEAANAVILGNVTDRGSYETALRLYQETLCRAKLLGDAANVLKKQAARIGELAAQYAESHTTALSEPLAEIRAGIRSGSVTLDGIPFRLTLSKGDVCRISGDSMSQKFLKGLPEEWVRQKLELDKTALKDESAAKLRKHDLHRPDKAAWTVGEEMWECENVEMRK